MRYKLLIILTLISFLLCSCQQEQEQRPRPPKPLPEKTTSSEPNNGEMETGNIGGDYIYGVSVNDILIKYHIPSGTATWVCQDLFCTHDESMRCPFAVTPSGYAAMGNLVYYAKEIDGQWRLRSYDGDSMQVQELLVSNGVINRLFTYNYYLYFSESERVDRSLINTTVYRWDAQSGKTETIDCGYPGAEIEKIEAGRIVWKKGDTYFSTDLDGEDERDYSQIFQREWGNYVYSWKVDSNAWYEMLWSMDLTTGKKTLIGEDISFFYFYGDKVVYLKYLDTPRKVVTKETGKELIDQYGSEVYVMNADGSNNRLVCNLDEFVFGGTSFRRNNEFVCGDWIGISSSNYYPNENTWGGAAFCTTDMLIINVVSGEYKLIKFNPFE